MPRFTNLDGTGPHTLADVLKWALLDRALGRRRVAVTDRPAPRVEVDRAPLAAPPRGAKPARAAVGAG